MSNKYFTHAAIFALIGVGLGAFGAHGLQKLTDDEKIIHGFQTGVQYQIYHALALLITSLYFDKLNTVLIKRACFCFSTGIILFSGSLYLITLFKIQLSTLTKIAGPITPIGGLFFLAGWSLLVIAGLKQKGFQKG